MKNIPGIHVGDRDAARLSTRVDSRVLPTLSTTPSSHRLRLNRAERAGRDGAGIGAGRGIASRYRRQASRAGRS